MMVRLRLLVPGLVALATLAAPARADQRVLVVPDGAAVAVPARGSLAPPRQVAAPAPRPRPARLAPAPVPEATRPAVPSAAAAILPLAAAAILAATLAGGGGMDVSAPVRTR